MESSNTRYVCTVCKSFSRWSYKPVLFHMRSHRLDPNLSLKCGINSCTEKYTVYESFRSHVYRKHRDVLYPNTTDSDDNLEEIEDNGDDNNALEVTSDDEDENIESGSSQTTTSTSSAKRAASLFILKIREENRVTQTALNNIVHGVKELWRCAIQNVKVSTMLYYLYNTYCSCL